MHSAMTNSHRLPADAAAHAIAVIADVADPNITAIPEEGVFVARYKQGLPCVFVPGRVKPMMLDPDELSLLEQCDGRTPIKASPLTDRLEAMRIIRRYKDDTETVRPLRIVEYPNFYVNSIDWTITDRCNYNCRHCFHAADNTTHRDEFSFEEAEKFLDEVKTCGIRSISLTGGEPTLYPRFQEVVEAIRDRGLYLNTLITNGSCLTPKILSFLKELHPEVLVRISFDGIGWHDWMRQFPGSEQKTIEAIRMCREAGLEVHVNVNVHRRNMEVMFDTVKMLADLGVGRIRIIRTSESPRWELNKGNDTLSPEEYYDLSANLAEQYRKSYLSVPVVIWQSLFLNGKKKNYHILPIKGTSGCISGKEQLCSALIGKPSVQANGDVVPCAPMGGYYAYHGIRLGNVFEKSLSELLTKGPFVDMITSTVQEKLLRNPKCAACEYVNECRGGCPALSLISGSSEFSSDEYKCIFFNKGYVEKYRRAMEGWREIGENP